MQNDSYTGLGSLPAVQLLKQFPSSTSTSSLFKLYTLLQSLLWNISKLDQSLITDLKFFKACENYNMPIVIVQGRHNSYT